MSFLISDTFTDSLVGQIFLFLETFLTTPGPR